MTIIGNSLFNAGATVDTSKDGNAASFQAAIGTTYEIDLSLNASAGETVVTFPSSPTRGDAFAVVITGTGTERVVSFTGIVSGASATAGYGLSRTAQYAIFRYFNATVGWLMHTNKHDVNNTIANGNTNLVLGSDNTCDARSSIGSMCVGHNNSATGSVDNVIVGTANSSNTNNTVTMGSNCTTSGNDAAAFGVGCTASGYKSSAFGHSNTASGQYSVAVGQFASATEEYSNAVGNNVTASGGYSSAFGCFSTSAGTYASAVGYYNVASGVYGSAFGCKSTAGGAKSSAFGYLAKTTVGNTVEIGRWANGTTRGGGIRTDTSGVVQFTIEDSATAPADGGATQGSEAEGNLGRGMFTIHKNGSAVTLYYNNAGTIESVNLGTLV